MKKIIDLRRQYPHIPFDIFVRWVEGINLNELTRKEQDDLHLILSEEEEKGKREQEAMERFFRERLSQLSASLIHKGLDVRVPGLDREHLQAILVYGFVTPSRQYIFAGGREITPVVVRQFVSNKLAMDFDLDEFKKVFRWLDRNKVIVSETKKQGFALSTHPARCTSEGQKVLQVTIKFAREVRSKK